MKAYILKRPLLLCSIICVTISITGYYSEATTFAFGIFYAIFIGFSIYKGIKPQILIALILAFIMLIGTVATIIKAERINNLDTRKITAKAVVCEITNQSEGYNSAIMEIVGNENLPINMRVYCNYSPVNLSEGQMIEAEFKFKRIKNDITKASNYSENVFIAANLYKISVIEEETDIVLSCVGKVRSYIKTALFSNMNYSEASTMCALVFGDKSYFSNEFYSNVKGAGVSHVMVVSGMHLSILVVLCLKISEKLFYNKYLRTFIMLSVVIILTALCGFTMSILRAGITYVFVALALVLNKDNTPANTLGAAVVTVLIMSPFATFNVAFQLSVLSTFGILAVAIPITDYIKNRGLIKNKILYALFSAVIITLSATLLTLPVSIYTFGYVSTVSVITNLLISYAVTLALSISVIALILNLSLPFIAEILFKICESIVKYINYVINAFGSTPFSVINLPRWTAILAIIAIIFIFYALLACKKRIDMIKLEEMIAKIEKEGGKRLKWQ